MRIALEGELGATLSIHELASYCLAARVATGLALPGWSALVRMLGVSEDTGWSRGGVGGHEFAVLRETEEGLVPVVVATERGDDALVQMIQEALGGIAGRL